MNRRLVFLLISCSCSAPPWRRPRLQPARRRTDSPTAGRAGGGYANDPVVKVRRHAVGAAVDLECLTGNGTTGAPAVVCYKHTAPRSSIYVQFEPTLMKVMRIQGGGLVEVARYRR